MQKKIATTLRRKRRHQGWLPAEEPFPSEAEAAALLRKLAMDEAGISKERQSPGAATSGELPVQINP